MSSRHLRVITAAAVLALFAAAGPASLASAGVAACTVTGTAGADVLTGTAGADVVCGLGGDDVMSGGAGSDIFRGGAGNDTVSYDDHVGNVVANLDGARNDGVAGERDTVGADVENLIGGDGNDTLTGTLGVNALAGGPGYDMLIGRAGADSLDGGTGVDTVSYAGTATPVTVSLDGVNDDGAAGENDAITAVENVLGGNAADTLTGNTGANVLTGGLGNDTLLGGDGVDTLSGGIGNDLLDGQDGADLLLGGVGSDTATYAGRSADVTATLDNLADDGELGEADNLRSDIEIVLGGAGDDTLTGSGLANTLDGGDGNDTLRGQGGKDTLRAGNGNDTVHYDTLDTTIDTGPGTNTCTRNTRAAACPWGVPMLTAVLPGGVDSSGVDYAYPTYDGPALSADGSVLLFESAVSSWVPGDTNGSDDAFVRDNRTGTVTRVSVASDGTEANSGSYPSAISGDGRYAVFYSYATNLVPGDTNGASDVFVHDRQTGLTTRVSVASDGAQADAGSGRAAISDDGRYVAFQSDATSLVPGDTNGASDVFMHDRQTATTTRVSVATGGAQGDYLGSYVPALSGNGRYVAFLGYSTNLVPGDTNGESDLFLHDRQLGTTLRISVATNGTQADEESSWPEFSADGRYVVYASDASTLVAGDTNAARDVFRYDRVTGTTMRVSTAADGSQINAWNWGGSVSADGRYVTFGTSVAGLVAGDTNGVGDAFIKDVVTGAVVRVSVRADGTQSDVEADPYAMSADGSTVAFVTYGGSGLAPDGNPDGDDRMYLWRR